MKTNSIIKIFCIVMLIIGWGFVLGRDFFTDELEAVHTAWKIVQGGEIYNDFFQHHHPFLYYLLAPIILVFGDNISTLLVCKIILFFTGVGTCFYTYRLALSLYGDKQAARASLILLLGLNPFMMFGFQIRPDVPMLLFSVMAVYYLFDFFATQKNYKLYISAISLGISFLFLQKAVIIIALLSGIIAWNIYNKRITLRDCIAYAGILISTVLPYYVYLLYSGQLENYILLNWILNSKMIPKPGINLFTSFFAPLLISLLSVGFYVEGIWAGRVVPQQRQLVFLSLGLLLSVLLYPHPYGQYILPALPYIAVIGGYALAVRAVKSPMLIIASLTLYAMIMGCVYLGELIINPLSKQLNQINYVLSVTGKEDRVLEGSYVRANLFRQDVDYFWFQNEPKYGAIRVYKEMTGYTYDPYVLLEQTKPKIICIDVLSPYDCRVTMYYKPSGIIKELWVRVTE